MKKLVFLPFLFLIILSGCSFFNKITPAEFYQQKLEISLKKDFIDLGVISTTNVCNTTIDIQKNDSGKQVDFTINTNSNWIVIAEKNKSFTANNTFVGLSINPTVLIPGEYIGTVDLDFKYNGISFVKKQVKIKIIITDKPFINPDKNSINWAYIKKDEITMDKIILSNPSQYSYNWEVQADVNWLSFASQSGTVNPNQTNELVININTNGLNYGTYTGKITITSNTENIYEKTKIIDVSITVSPPVLYTNTDVIDFGLIGIAETKTLTFTLSNPGSGTIDWTANDDTKFITLSKTNGTLDKNVELITVTLNTTNFSSIDLTTGTITIITTSTDVVEKVKKIGVKFSCDTNNLIKNQWKSDYITSSESVKWYSINAIKGNEYKIEWSSNLSLNLSIYRENKTTSYATDIYANYSAYKTIIALETEKIYIKIQAYSSGNTGSFTIKYSYSESRTPIQLTTNDTYIEGDATDDDIRWYYINGVKGQKYDILWKDYNNNSSAYTGYVNISAYREDKTTSYFTNDNYSPGQTITAAETEKVYIKVTAPSRKGTFAIKFCDETPSELTNYLSKDGYISSGMTSRWYYINAIKGDEYKIDCYPSMSIYLSIYRENKSVSYFSDIYISSSSTHTVTALETEKIYIKIQAYSSGNTGSFTIKYSSHKNRTPIQLTTNDTDVTGDATDDDIRWYYINGVKGEDYSILWKEYGTSGYTGDIYAAAYREDKTTTYFTNATNIYSTVPITAVETEKIYLKIVAPSTKGTFAIKYLINQTAQLTNNISRNGTITNQLPYVWYYINAVNGNKYNISWTESLDIKVSAYRENKTTSYFTNNDYSYGQITALATERIYIKVEPYSSGNTGNFTMKYSSPQDRAPIGLTTNDTYIEGDATDDDIRWYYINGVKGQKYDILWKGYNNSSAYTGYVNISAYREDKTAFYFTNDDYSPGQTITAAETEKIYLKVTAPSRKGTFAIKFCDETPSQLTNYVSKDGYLSSGITTRWYYINAVKGTEYKIEYPGGMSVYLSAYRENKSTSYFIDNYAYSSFSKTITALETEKIYIKINGNSGTFTIKYSPIQNKTPIELTGNDIYLSGDVTDDDIRWYYFNAVANQKYDIVWKEYGITGYTGNIQVTAYREDKLTSYFSNIDSYSNAQTITALASEKVYLKVNASTKGTFAIKYYYNVPQELTNLTYKEGNISSGIPTRWYYINATKGSEYKIECSNMAIYLSAYREDKSTSYFVNSYTYSSVTKTITALETEKIYIKVDSYSGGTGSFNIKYTAIKHSTPVEIINDTYTVGDVSGDEVDWYSFNATTGEDYYIYWNESGTGTDSYTGDVIVNAYKEDKTTSYFTDRDTGFRLPKLINATETGTIYLKVTPTTKGTYAIKFYNNAKVLLTNDTYKEESISNIITTKWFYFNATKGSIYQIYWDDYYDGSYKYISDIKVSAYREDKTTTYFSNIDKGYTTPQTITALETEKIYIKVDSNSNRTGNFAVKYVNVP